MTEVRKSSLGNLGLFATKPYKAGDEIWKEKPIIKLSPLSAEESESLLIDLVGDQKKKSSSSSSSSKVSSKRKTEESTTKSKQTTLWGSIEVPESVPIHFRGTFRGMVQAGLCYLKRPLDNDKDKRKQLLDLYHPKLNTKNKKDDNKKTSSGIESDINDNNMVEDSVVKLAIQAVEYLKKSCSVVGDGDDDDDIWSTIVRVMLIWACNSFEGGRIYPLISRVNHHCDPNAIIQPCEDDNRDNNDVDDNNINQTLKMKSTNKNDNKNDMTDEENKNESQRLVAATEINAGEEISISYLGLLLYAETSVRQNWLQKTKFFTCHCSRCCSSTNKDDGNTTSTTTNTSNEHNDDLAAMVPCPVCHPREGPQQSLEEDVQYDDEQTVQYISVGIGCGTNDGTGSSTNITTTCPKTKTTFHFNNDDTKKEKKKNHHHHHSNGTTDIKKLYKIMTMVTSKVVSFLETYKPSKGKSNSTTKKKKQKSAKYHDDNDDDDDDDDDDDEVVLEELVSLASTIHGAKHWTTNIVMLLYLDNQLLQLSNTMLSTYELPDEDEIGQCIDSLQRIVNYLSSLQLKLHIGHVLSDTIISIARILVSFGDIKSQKYASEWLDIISPDYINTFESSSASSASSASSSSSSIGGRQKVVMTLQNAWKKHELSDDSNEKKRKNKKKRMI